LFQDQQFITCDLRIFDGRNGSPDDSGDQHKRLT
jgi:hypothetical protein